MPAATFAIRAAVSGLSPESRNAVNAAANVSPAPVTSKTWRARAGMSRGAPPPLQAHAALGPREDQRREPEPLEQPFGAGSSHSPPSSPPAHARSEAGSPARW